MKEGTKKKKKTPHSFHHFGVGKIELLFFQDIHRFIVVSILFSSKCEHKKKIS